MKFKIGDKVTHYGIVGVIKEVKFGGYLVDYGAHVEDPQHDGVKFAYESELTVVSE